MIPLVMGWMAVGCLVMGMHWELGGREEFFEGIANGQEANDLGDSATAFVAVIVLLVATIAFPFFIPELIAKIRNS